jgi:predicted nuclease with TOPRIM domain
MEMEGNFETVTDEIIVERNLRIDELRRRRIAATNTLKARYAELRDEMNQIEREIRVLYETWVPPR